MRCVPAIVVQHTDWKATVGPAREYTHQKILPLSKVLGMNMV